MSNNYIPYSVEFSNSHNILKIKSDVYTYMMHLSTNYPNYKWVTPNFIKKVNHKTGDKSIEKWIPYLTKDWNLGNFIIENNIK